MVSPQTSAWTSDAKGFYSFKAGTLSEVGSEAVPTSGMLKIWWKTSPLLHQSMEHETTHMQRSFPVDFRQPLLVTLVWDKVLVIAVAMFITADGGSYSEAENAGYVKHAWAVLYTISSCPPFRKDVIPVLYKQKLKLSITSCSFTTAWATSRPTVF